MRHDKKDPIYIYTQSYSGQDRLNRKSEKMEASTFKAANTLCYQAENILLSSWFDSNQSL